MEQMSNLLFSSTNMAAMTKRENYLFGSLALPHDLPIDINDLAINKVNT